MKASKPKKRTAPDSTANDSRGGNTRPKPPGKRTPIGAAKPGKKSTGTNAERWNLRLYVAGQTPRSLTAFANLKRLCEERLAGRYAIEVVDLVKQPQLAQGDQIVAIPTLVRKIPQPIKRIVGDLSNIERVLVGMDLQAAPGTSSANS